jgi:uncharacterized protein (TIGR03435 family)
VSAPGGQRGRERFPLKIIAATALVMSAVFGQTAATRPTFEVASIKASTMTPSEALNAGRNVGIKVDGARLDIGLGSLTFLIATAYRLEVTRISGPDWMAGQRFDIQAKIPEGANKEQVPEMLQALLAERFKLAAHREQKEQQVYALVVDKAGPKLQESVGDAGTSGKPFPHGNDGRKLLTVIHGPDGPETVSLLNGATIFEAEKISLPELALFLRRYADLPVIDMTGLKGTYQVAMNIPDRTIGGRFGGRGPNGAATGDASRPADLASDPGGVSIFASVKKAGLNLEKRKAPLDYLIVDHVEKVPTEN